MGKRCIRMFGKLPLKLISYSLFAGGVNVAEALVSKGLATVVRYSADNDQRSSK